ncbi:MAG: hypothetical protein WCX81_03340 [Monoglobales bacterium]
MSNILKRSEKIPFYGVVSDENVVYTRMTGFTEISVNKNPIEHKRQYIDEDFERNDVVGYTTSIGFSFDMFKDDAVHSDIAAIFDGEHTGNGALRSIIIVDLSSGTDGEYTAVKRDFTLIPDKEGDSNFAYTYSGTLNAAGEKVFGTATSQDEWQTCTFTANV